MDFASYLKVHEWEIDEYVKKFDMFHLMHAIQNKTVKMPLTKLEKLVVMAKYLKDNPSVTQEEFMKMLNAPAFKKYKKVADLYQGNDLVEQLRTNGGVHVAGLIENPKKTNKEIQK